MENFIDYRTTVKWHLKTHRLAQPHMVFNVDGTKNQAGEINKSCMLRVEKDQKSVEQRFYVTNLGVD
jgi:hypothetical protein